MGYIRDGNVAHDEDIIRSPYQCLRTTSCWEVAAGFERIDQAARNSSERLKCNVIEAKNLTTRISALAFQRDFAKVERTIEFLQEQFHSAAFQPTGDWFPLAIRFRFKAELCCFRRGTMLETEGQF